MFGSMRTGPAAAAAPFPGVNPEVNEPHIDNFAVTSLSRSFALNTTHFPLHFCLICLSFVQDCYLTDQTCKLAR